MIGVTITGADDAVDPAALIALSIQYPCVEWGVLMSETREGTPRYPSKDWVLSFCKARRVASSNRNGYPFFAVHLCGNLAQRASLGSWLWPASAGRFQLNGVRLPAPDDEAEMLEALTEASQSLVVGASPILQCPSADELDAYCAFAARIPGCSVLYDPSGGRGLSAAMPAKWPSTRVRLGFAGGITPDNVLAVLSRLATCAFRPAWIDMESGVRTNDRLDLDKVQKVLKAIEAVNRWLRNSRPTMREGA